MISPFRLLWVNGVRVLMCNLPSALSAKPIIVIIYPLTERVVREPQMFSQPVSSIFPFSPKPSVTWWTSGLPFPWCCLPTSSSVCLVVFPLPRSDELRTQKLKSHLVRTQSLNVLPLKPGVGQYIAIHSTLTERHFFLAYFYPSSPFTCIFCKTAPDFSGVGSG